jgi:hypothetical protein
MRISYSTAGRRDGKQWRWAPLVTLTFSSLVARQRKLNEKELDEIATDSTLHARR